MSTPFDPKGTVFDNQPQKQKRGFAALSPERRREIASQGGIAAHKSGNAHQYTSEEGRAAGLKRHLKNEAVKAEGAALASAARPSSSAPVFGTRDEDGI